MFRNTLVGFLMLFCLNRGAFSQVDDDDFVFPQMF
jgi:hypothetical protein